MDLKKELSGVADAAAKIMAEALKGQQHQIDKNKNQKIDSEDFKILRGEKKTPVKEEQEQVEEASYSAKAARAGKDIGKPGKMFSKIAASAAKRYGSEERGKKVAGAVLAKLRKEETCDEDIEEQLIEELLNELEFDKNGRYVHKAKPPAKDPNAGVTDWEDEEKKAKQFTSGKGEKKPTARKKYGARQNYIRSTRVNESFSDLLGVYKEHGLKGLAEAMIKEEPTNDQYNAELEDNKAKAEGKKKQPELAKGSVQAVKQEEVEVIDANEVNGVQIDTIEERQMTEPEMKKREEIVKGMKKGLEGFKQRYGERAKSVMYATATKQAMK